jgi:hypothetical protein
MCFVDYNTALHDERAHTLTAAAWIVLCQSMGGCSLLLLYFVAVAVCHAIIACFYGSCTA